VAHTSIATVSKVANGRAGVSADTRARVEAAIADLGYASIGERQVSLLAAQEMSIEIVVDPGDVANPYLSKLLGGAIESATGLGCALVLRSVESAASEPAVAWAQRLARAGRAGVVEVTSAYSEEREKALKKTGLPMVLIDPINVPRTVTQSIGATNWSGAYEATAHLLELGHTRVRYIGGPPGAHCDIARAHGWAAAMSDAGLDVNATDVPRLAYTFEHGLSAATALISGSSPPSAIFAGSDTIAAGVLEAARRLGTAVPAELSVVGFDDTLLASVSAPPLTTVHQPIADIGRAAVATLVRIARGHAAPAKRVELSTHLVIRQSTAPPKP
jgi:LacI family transcriptional regulator